MTSHFWPLARLGEGLATVLGRTTLPCPSSRAEVPDWIETAAAGFGVDASHRVLRHGDLRSFLRHRTPSVVLLRRGDGCFLIGGRKAGAIRILGDDGEYRRSSSRKIRELLESEVLAERRSEVESLLAAGGSLSVRSRARAAKKLTESLLDDSILADVWSFRPLPGAPLGEVTRGTRLQGFLALFVGTYVLDYLLFVLSWWILGRGALSGRIEWNWLVGWALLFAGMLPLRMLSTWSEGRLAVAAGTILKQRLLSGALALEPEETQADGVGRHLARVFESEAVESLALSGGLLSAAASIELVVAVPILLSGAGGVLHAGLVGLVLGAFAFIARRSFLERRLWTDQRLEMSHDSVERMVGHQTRLVQERPERWHREEEQLLSRYMKRSERVDRLQCWLQILPRLLLLVGFLGLSIPFLEGGASLERLAVGVGGTILASRALSKLVLGFSNLLDAAIAWQRVAFLFRAASRQPAAGDPGARPPADAAVVETRGVSFVYPGRSEPVLRNVELVIERGDRNLLRSPSGSGKSTLISILSGLRSPSAGSVLLDGMSRDRLGAFRWTRRVATAPQFHENHVFTETFAFNLLMGRRWPPTGGDLQEAEALCREIGLGDLLDQMSGGLNQLVGDTGWQLSHGERSRLFLARALLQGGDLVLLDESFAALDPENLRKALLTALSRAKSLLVVGHV